MAPYAEVVVNRKVNAIDHIFHYHIPAELVPRAQLGCVVAIPFGVHNQLLEGVIVGFSEQAPPVQVKDIQAVRSEKPLFSEKMIALSRWIADYYMCPWVAALQAMLPAGVSLSGHLAEERKTKIYRTLPLPPGAKLTEKQAVIWQYIAEQQQISAPALVQAGFSADICRRMVAKGFLAAEYRSLDENGAYAIQSTELNKEQEAAYQAILAEMAGKQRPFLLWGITGSGKTEIYLRLLEQTIAGGRQGMLLVPEIALTGQMVAFLRRRLDVPTAVLHSGLSLAQRRHTWQRIAEGAYPLVIGARSAIFAPLPNLGMIILDEEQDGSYKQDNAPRFHSREVAKELCRLHGAQLVLGSATPAIETAYAAQTKRYALAALKNRYYGMPLPQVQIVDMRRELRAGNHSLFSRALQEGIAACLERGEQALLLLNRRGYYTAFTCRECGETILCPHCNIPMAYHATEKRLKCHYCGRLLAPPQTCPKCGSPAIASFGAGTQRVVAEVAKLFPQARIARLDHDAALKRGQSAEIYRQMLERELDILVGTQMIAKGLDFPHVTLSGVLAADLSLNLPDWRAGERAFQLLTQVIGRSGRRYGQGSAILQTYNPGSLPILAAAAQDYGRFYRGELRLREADGYPPFMALARIIVNGMEREEVAQAASALAKALAEKLGQSTEILGPAPAPYEKIKDRYRWHLILKGKSLEHMREALRAVLPAWEKSTPKTVYAQVDIDPYSVM